MLWGRSSQPSGIIGRLAVPVHHQIAQSRRAGG
jgi:hypothetical protein